MDWYTSRKHVRWEYRRVLWPSFVETGETYDGIAGGSNEYAFFTAIRESGSIDVRGVRPQSPDLVRAYYYAEDENGDSVERVVFTMLAETSKLDETPSRSVSNVKLYGLLKVASDKEYGLPYTIPAGTNAVAKARELAEGLGLQVNAQASTSLVTSPHTFESSDSYLTIINWLLSCAGYGSAYTDEYGTVQMQPYVGNARRDAIWEFIEGDKSMIETSVSEETNYADTPNVVRAYAETEDWSVWAAAFNEDATHAASLTRNGNREKTLTEEVSELSATTSAAAVEELKEYAAKKLTDNSSSIRYGEAKVLAYMPVREGDPCIIKAGSLELNGTVTNVKVTHSARSPMTVKAREYVTATFKPRTEGGAL